VRDQVRRVLGAVRRSNGGTATRGRPWAMARSPSRLAVPGRRGIVDLPIFRDGHVGIIEQEFTSRVGRSDSVTRDQILRLQKHVNAFDYLHSSDDRSPRARTDGVSTSRSPTYVWTPPPRTTVARSRRRRLRVRGGRLFPAPATSMSSSARACRSR
jgi:hypothetical protein